MDIYSDKNFKELTEILTVKPGLVPFVKQANVSQDDMQKLAMSCFAWPALRRFRIDTPAHALLSYEYMQKHASEIPLDVKDRINNALVLYDLEPNTFEKQASYDENDYIFPDEKRYLVVDEETYKHAHDALLRNFTKISWDKRSRACIKLAEKAQKFDQKMHPQLLRHASLVSCDLPKLATWLRQRATLTYDKERVSVAFDSMANRLEKTASGDRDDLMKIVETIHFLDKTADLEKYYDKKIPDPVAAVFNTEKFASVTVNLAGKEIDLNKLSAIDPGYYGDILGRDIIPEISTNNELDPMKIASVFRTFPLDMQKMLVERLSL